MEPRSPSDPTHEAATRAVDQPELQKLLAELQSRSAVPDPADGPWQIGPYRLVRELGRGSMSVVYLARHDKLDRDVALKLLPRSVGPDDAARQRFLLEARAMARIEHASVVRIHDVLETEGTLAIAMERIDGATLAQIVAHLRDMRTERGSGPDLDGVAQALGIERSELSARSYADWTARVGRDLANALQCVHDTGLTHRDVKPSNVMVDTRGRARLADFGVVREESSNMTATGGFVGTAMYASPEQLRGDPHVDARADVYGLGATLCELLSMDPPVRGSPATILDTVQRGGMVPLLKRGLPIDRSLSLVVERALAPEPDRRYRSALAMAADLQAYLEGRTISVRPVTRLERVALWARREPTKARLAALALGAIIGLVSVGGYLLAQWSRIRTAAELETQARFDELVEMGFAIRAGSGDTGEAITLFRRALSMQPRDPLAIGALALSLSASEDQDDARGVLEQLPADLRAHPGLAYLAEVGVDLVRRPPDFDRKLLTGPGVPLLYFFAALAAQQRAENIRSPNGELTDRSRALMADVTQLLQRAVLTSEPVPRIFRVELADAAATAGEDRIALDQVEVLRERWLAGAASPPPSIAYRVARTLLELKRPAEALEVCESPPYARFDPVAAVIVHARALDALHREDDAIALLELATQRKRGAEHVYNALAARYADRGDKENEMRCRQKLIGMMDALVDQANRDGVAATNLRVSWIDSCKAVGRDVDEEGILTEHISRFPRSWIARAQIAFVLATRAAELRRNHQGSNTLAAMTPEDRDAVGDLTDRAREMALSAFEAAPFRHDIIKLTARVVLVVAHDAEAALPALRNLIRIDPDDLDAHHLLGDALYRLGRYEEAIPALRAASASPDASPLLGIDLGWCLLETGRIDDALTAFEQSLEKPDLGRRHLADAQVGIAAALVRRAKRSDEDVAAARRALKIAAQAVRPVSDWLHATTTAEVYHAAGDDERARFFMERAEAARQRAAAGEPTAEARDLVLAAGERAIQNASDRMR